MRNNGGMKVGQFIGPFEVGGKLGEGGMAVVFSGWHRRDRSPVAIKIMKPDALPELAMESMFAHEVRSAARLNHPNVTAVFDHGVLDGLSSGRPVLDWMPLACHGGGVRRNSQAPRWAGTMARKVPHSEQRLECPWPRARGMIHRDIKPGNILIDQTTGQIKLTDFGLTCPLRHAELAATGEFMTGTPSFMAPEQIRGHRRAQGPWSDIYSVGALGWTLLTGRPPYCGSLEEVCRPTSQATCARSFPPSTPRPRSKRGCGGPCRPIQRTDFSARQMLRGLSKLPSTVGASETLDLKMTMRSGPRTPFNSTTGGPCPSMPGRKTGRPQRVSSRAQQPTRPDLHSQRAGDGIGSQEDISMGPGLHSMGCVPMRWWVESGNEMPSGSNFTSVGSSTARLVIVEGPQGVGKSTLVHWMLNGHGQAQTINFQVSTTGQPSTVSALLYLARCALRDSPAQGL